MSQSLREVTVRSAPEAVLEEELSRPLSGASLASKALDLFVISHTMTAASFATLMLVFPEAFSYLVENPENFTAITSDSIRWACPFVFGFCCRP